MCHKIPRDDPTLPHLFQKNSVVQHHNQKMLTFFHTTLYVLEAIDQKDIPLDMNEYQNEKTSLPTTILLKLGILVELIAGNLDTEDGLGNDADRIFQLYTTNKKDIVWVQFKIGRSRR